MKTRYIVIFGFLSAILFVSQISLGFLPNIELVSLLIIIFSLIYGSKALFIIYAFVLLQGVYYGFGIWFFNYLYIWAILFALVMAFRKNSSPIFWALISGFYGLSFGALSAIPYFIIGGLPMGFAYWFSGIPFDIAHGIGNFFIALVLFRPLYALLQKLENHQ